MNIINNYIEIRNKYKINDTQYLIYLYLQSKIYKNIYKISNKEIANIFNLSTNRIAHLIADLIDKKLIFTYNPTTNTRLIFLSKQQLETYIKNN